MDYQPIKTVIDGEHTYVWDDKTRILEIFRHYSPMIIERRATEAEFDNHVAKKQLHHAQLATLPRREIRWTRGSMWGAVQGAREYSEGIVSVHTAGHGGFILDEERNSAVHPAWQAQNGQYEEDCHWAVVAMTFPDLFTDLEKESALRTVKNDYPHQLTAATGMVVAEEESHTLKAEAAARRNKNKWVVISALNDNALGMVRCTATIGGNRSSSTRREYLVPKDEYAMPVGGFVIDEDRHELAA